MNIDEFIIELQSISEVKRKLPILIQCPNGMYTNPNIKMKFDGTGHPILGDKLEAMVVTWRD